MTLTPGQIIVGVDLQYTATTLPGSSGQLLDRAYAFLAPAQESGQPLPGARVVARLMGTAISVQGVTDNQGQYRLPVNQTGRWQVQVMAEDIPPAFSRAIRSRWW